LSSNIKCYVGNAHYTDSQNSDTTALSGREHYHLQFWIQAASSEILDTPSYNWSIWTSFTHGHEIG